MLKHDLARIADDADVLRWVEDVKRTALTHQRLLLPFAHEKRSPAAATFTYTNHVYRSGFDNWIYSARAALTTPAVLAMDEQTYNAFAARNVSVLLLHDSESVALAKRSLYIKAEFTHRLLAAGLRTIFSEMDIFWVNDPQLIEDRELDLQASEQGYGKDDINFGFYMAQPTRAARSLFRRLARWPPEPHTMLHCQCVQRSAPLTSSHRVCVRQVAALAAVRALLGPGVL